LNPLHFLQLWVIPLQITTKLLSAMAALRGKHRAMPLPANPMKRGVMLSAGEVFWGSVSASFGADHTAFKEAVVKDLEIVATVAGPVNSSVPFLVCVWSCGCEEVC
jgi:hypothetical protein